MLELNYIGLSMLMGIILFLMGNHAITQSTTDQGRIRRKQLLLLSGLALWHVYILMLGLSGILQDFRFPPRFVIFLIAPAFIFTGVFLGRHRRSKWIQSIPPIWLTAYQIFRIAIESLFVFSVAAGLLHKNVSIEGYNYDMIYAFTAIGVTAVIFFSRSLPSRVLIVWNYFGLLVIASIIFLFISTIYFPEFYGPDTAAFPSDFGKYPYALVPGFLMPSAVFVHVLSLIQLHTQPKPQAIPQ